MRKFFIYFVEKQLLRHKFFYILLFLLIILLTFIFQNSWFIRGWIKYCNESKICLADFNSVFELCAAFNLAYTAIKFKGNISIRLYNWVGGSLRNARIQADSIILTVEENSKHNDELAEYIEDIDTRQQLEKSISDNDYSDHGVDTFLYFGFYSIICLIVGGLEQGILTSISFKLEAYSFLFLFSIASVLYVEVSYLLSKKSHFEITVLAFFIILFVCFSYARNLEYLEVKYAVSSYKWNSNLFYNTGNFKAAINYAILLCVFINLYPYFLLFRNLYFVCLQYTCTSYQIITAVHSKRKVIEIADSMGEIIEKAGGHITSVGKNLRHKN